MLYTASLPEKDLNVKPSARSWYKRASLDASLIPFRYTSLQNSELNKPMLLNVIQSKVQSMSHGRLGGGTETAYMHQQFYNTDQRN